MPIVHMLAEHYLRDLTNYLYADSWQFTAMIRGDRKEFKKAKASCLTSEAQMREKKEKLATALRQFHETDREGFRLLGITTSTLIALEVEDYDEWESASENW